MKTVFKTVLAALLSGLLSTACVEPLAPVEIGGEGKPEVVSDVVTFTATIEHSASGTKTALDGLNVVWSEGDQIRIFNAANPAGGVFTLASGAGSAKGTFSGNDIGEGPYFAIYPANSASFTGSEMIIEVPGTQHYAAGSFGNGANISWARGDSRENLSFSNAGGAVSFTLAGSSTIKGIKLYTKGSELLNGTLTISGLDSETPSASVTASQADDDNRFIWLDCGAGVPLTSEGVTFIVAVPVGAFADGFVAEFVDSDGMTMIKSAKGGSENTVVRSVIRKMPAFAYSPMLSYAFLSEKQDFSAYSAVNTTAYAQACQYDPERSQYSLVNNTGSSDVFDVRFQDWTDGYSLGLKISPKVFTVGSMLDVTVEALGNTGSIVSGSGEMQVVKILDGRAWIFDSEAGNGYVVLMEE